MIKINLAKRRKASGATATNIDLRKADLTNFISKLFKKKDEVASADLDGTEKKFDINGPIPRLIMAAVACYVVDDTLTNYKTEALDTVKAELAAVEKEKASVRAKLEKIKDFEPIKKQLEDDERTIKNKLEVINTLLEDRNLPSKIMMQVAQSIPEEVWLTDLKFDREFVKLNGATPGYNQVSDFIKSLNNTSHFTEIGLSGIQESTTLAKDQRVQTFELKAKRRHVN